MTHLLNSFKRLSLVLLVFSVSAGLIFLLMAVFQVGVAADLESQPDLLATPIPSGFGATDPFICTLPEDGVFLPCHANLLADEIPIQRSGTPLVSGAPCEDGMAAGYPCDQVDLLSLLTLDNFGGATASDMWGWTDPSDGKEVVILTLRDRTAFVDISDPFNPAVLGALPTTAGANASPWRDVKTYQNTAYIVGDIAGGFGMQIFDLTRLRGVTETTSFAADNLYMGISSTHNIVINEESGLAALVGISSGKERCRGGMHLLDLSNDRLDPAFLGCVDEDGYVHDAQCVIYHGEDADYAGREICFNFNADSITIVDVTDRTNPIQLSRSTYSQTAYTHQGWVTADHGHLLVDDEGDERTFDINTTTHIWDISDLTQPKQIGTYTATVEAIDHNQYLHLGYSFQANYQAGMRILDTSQVRNGRLEEIAYFDVFPTGDDANFNGAWSTYPYFESGVIAISGIEQGLFLVRPTALESYRATLEAPSAAAVISGTTTLYDVALHTLGLADSYTLTQLTSVDPSWQVSTSQPSVFTGTSLQSQGIPISITSPSAESGQTEVNLILESHQRAGYFITATTHFRIEPGNLFDVVDNGKVSQPLQGDGNRFVESIQIVNRSGLPQSYMVEASGDRWKTTPSVEQTPLVAGDDGIYELLLGMAAEAGVQNSFRLTVTSENSPADSRVLTGTVMVDTAADLTSFISQTFDTITHTVQLTNSGDLTDRFELSLENGEWLGYATTTQTVPISTQAMIEFQVIVTRGDGFESQNRLQVTSLRSGEEVALIDLYSRIYQVHLPVILNMGN